MNYEEILKEFRDTVTAALTVSTDQVSKKIDAILTRLNELERSISALDNHRSSLSEKLVSIAAKVDTLDTRVKESENQLLVFKVQSQGLGKFVNALWGIGSSLIVGLILWYLKK